MKLETVQNTDDRCGMGAPRSYNSRGHMGNVPPYGYMGWRNFEDRIVKGKLGVIKKTEGMNVKMD